MATGFSVVWTPLSLLYNLIPLLTVGACELHQHPVYTLSLMKESKVSGEGSRDIMRLRDRLIGLLRGGGVADVQRSGRSHLRLGVALLAASLVGSSLPGVPTGASETNLPGAASLSDGRGVVASASFDDVPDGHYAEGAIGWAAAGGITTGVGNNLFGLGRTLTREQMVTFLCRAYNPPCAAGTARGSDTFDDVPAGHWADASIGWAVAHGITTGVSATRFGVGQTLTREQMVTFLYRAEGSPSVTVGASPFGDVAVGDGVWYERPVVWAFSEGISGGVASGVFGLGTTLSRGEMVLFLCRAVDPGVCAPSQTPIPTGVDGGSPPEPSVSSCEEPESVSCDREALTALYDATDGDNWDRNTNWKTTKPMSEWSGVGVDKSGRVRSPIPWPQWAFRSFTERNRRPHRTQVPQFEPKPAVRTYTKRNRKSYQSNGSTLARESIVYACAERALEAYQSEPNQCPPRNVDKPSSPSGGCFSSSAGQCIL